MFFRDVIGQIELKQSLIQSINNGRFAHAQLFTGRFGHGGLPIAIAFYRYLVCSDRKEEDACGACPSCLKINSLSHPDFHFIFPHIAREKNREISSSAMLNEWRSMVENQNGIKIQKGYFGQSHWEEHLASEKKQISIPAIDALEIIKKTTYKPYEATYQAVLVWMPEKMNTPTANKVLKVLEEPPANTIFLFVSESSEMLLPTVISRLQSIQIPSIEADAFKLAIGRLFSIDSISAKFIADKTQGDFLKAYEQASNTGNEYRELFIDWMRVCYKIDYLKIRDWLEHVSKMGRDEQVRFCNEALNIVRDCLMINYVGEESLLSSKNNGTKSAELERNFLSKFSPFIHANNAQDIIEEISELIYHIQRNVYRQVALMDVSFRLCKLLKIKPQD